MMTKNPPPHPTPCTMSYSTWFQFSGVDTWKTTIMAHPMLSQLSRAGPSGEGNTSRPLASCTPICAKMKTKRKRTREK